MPAGCGVTLCPSPLALWPVSFWDAVVGVGIVSLKYLSKGIVCEPCVYPNALEK